MTMYSKTEYNMIASAN